MDEQIPAVKRNAILLGVIIGLLMYRVVLSMSAEGLSIRRADKAASIMDWFGRVSAPTYTVYKNTFTEPNIVEYEDMLALHQSGNLTLKTAEEKIR